MRIIKKLFLSFVIAGLGFATLVGCVSLENAERISIVEMPTTTFVKNQETSGNLMKVLITDSEGNDVVLTLSYPDEKGNVSAQQDGVPFDVKITIKNFNLSTIGNKTASVTYGEATSYFDYQVVDPEQGFAGGNGSLNNPYQITNAIQFMNINTLETTKDVYFKLMNDIDMSTVLQDAKMFWDMGNAAIQLFEGVLDGNNKRIYNVVEPINYLFGELSGATLKDLSVFIKGENIALSCNANSYDNRTMSFLNVDLYGSVSTGYNYAGYATYPITLKYAKSESGYDWIYSTVVFKNCDSYLDNIGTSTRVGVFFAIPRGNYTFEKCYNYGYVEALNTSLLFTNSYASKEGDKQTVYKVISSGNKGTLSSVDAKSDLVFCNGANGVQVTKLEGSEELIEGTNLVIPTLDFTEFLQVQDNYLELKAVTDDSNITKVKVNLYFEGMSCKEYGTLTDFVTVELPVSSEVQKTGLFATEIKDGKLLIKVVTKGSIEDTTEASDEIVSLNKDWLTYNVTKGFYVFDGTKVKDGYTFSAGSQAFSIFAYNAENEVIASVKIATK